MELPKTATVAINLLPSTAHLPSYLNMYAGWRFDKKGPRRRCRPGENKIQGFKLPQAGTNSLQAPQCGKSGTWPRHLTPLSPSHTATVRGLSMQLAPAAEKVHTKAAALNTATRERQCRGGIQFPATCRLGFSMRHAEPVEDFAEIGTARNQHGACVFRPCWIAAALL